MRHSRTSLSEVVSEPTFKSTNDKGSERYNNDYIEAKKAEKRRRRERNNPPTKYREYITSHWWELRKKAYYKRHPKQCAVCHTDDEIDLHHLRYGNYGREKDEHLVPLCKRHHLTLHEEVGVKGNMVVETNTFIDEQSQLEEFPRF